jgi:hypothetical protein
VSARIKIFSGERIMRQTLPFFGTVAASGEQTLVSKRINNPFQIRNIKIYFDLGSELMVQNKIFSSGDTNDPAAGEPAGNNLFATLGQVDYIVGDGGWIEIRHEPVILESGTFLKVYAKNTDTFDHYVLVLIEIDDQISQ